jgi:hypothetical protein
VSKPRSLQNVLVAKPKILMHNRCGKKLSGAVAEQTLHMRVPNTIISVLGKAGEFSATGAEVKIYYFEKTCKVFSPKFQSDL